MAKKNGSAEVEVSEAEGEESLQVKKDEPMPFADTAKGKEEIVTLALGELVIDTDWNSRREATGRTPEEEGKRGDWPDDRLEASIRARVEEGKPALMQLPTVERLKDGRHRLVYGYRRVVTCLRVDPKMKHAVRVRGTTGDAKADDLSARIENLVENVQRQNLKPWEQAEALYQLKLAHPEVNDTELASKVGLTKTHVQNLIRLRRKLAPELWEKYVEQGEAMKLTDLIKVCAKPQEEQAEAYNAILRGEPAEGEEPRKKKGAKFKTWLKQVDRELRKENSAGREKYLKGLAYALNCVIGEAEWENPSVRETGRAASAAN